MPPTNNLSFSATGAEQAIQSVITAFNSYNAALNNVAAAQTKFTAQGRLMKTSLQSVTDAGNIFTANLRNNKGTLELVNATMTRSVTVLQRLAAARKAASGQVQLALAQPNLTNALQPPANISNLQKAKFDKLFQDSLKNVKAGDVSAKEFDNIFRLVRSGNKQMLDGVLEDTRQAIIKVMKEYNRLNNPAIQNKKNRANDAAFASQVPASITNAFGPLNSAATEAASLRVTNAMRNIMATLKTGQISWKEYNDVVSETKSRTGKIFEVGGEAAVQKQIQKIILEYNRATDAANKFAAAQKQTVRRNTAADVAGQKLRSGFDLSGLSGQGLERAQAQIAKIQNMLSSGKINYNQFREVFRAVETGAKTSFKGAEEAVRASMSRIGIEITNAKNPILSLGSAFKFLQAQIAFDIFSRLIGQFKNMASAAAEFQQRIALIQTISQDSSLTFNDWAENILKVSNNLGRPAEEVAAAAYDLLSNQITKGSDTFGALKTAGDFARTTNSGLEDSVNLLSSAINAFKLNAADAEKVSAQFFTAIDLGRLKASDLANTFGRVATTAQSLGANLQETLALLTVLTRQGIQPDTAQTLLTNVFQKLLKPTKDLQAVYDSLGVSSGELFVKTYGIVGALQKLQQVAGGSQSKLAGFFNEIRSFQGGNILTDRMEDVIKDLSLIENKFGNDTYTKAKSLTNDNFGQQFKQQMTEVTNYFKSEFETKILQGVISVTNYFGGLANIVKTLLPVFYKVTGAVVAFLAAAKIGSIIASFGGLTTAIQYTIAAARALSLAFATNPVTWIAAAAAGLAYFAVQAYNAREAWKLVPEEIRKANEAMKAEYLASVDQNLNNKRTGFIDQARSQQSEALKYLAAYGQELDKVRSKEAAAAAELKRGLNNEMNVLISNAKKVGTELSQALTKAMNSAKEAARAMRDLNNSSFSREISRGEKRNEINMNNARTAAELNGQDPEVAANNVDRSDAIFKRQLDYLNQRKAAAFKAGDVSQLVDTFKEINSLMDQIATKTRKVPVFDSNGNHTGKYFEQLTHPDFINNIDAEQKDQLALLDQVRQKKLGEAEATRQQIEVNKRLTESMESVAKSLGKFNPFDDNGKLKDGYKDVGDVLKELIDLQNKFNEAANELGGSLGGNALKTYKEQLERVQDLLKQQTESTGTNVGTERQQDALQRAQEGVSNGTEAATRGMDATIAKAKEAEEAWINAFNAYRQSAGELLHSQVENHDNAFPNKQLRGIGELFGRNPQQGLPATELLKGMDFAAQAGDIQKAKEQLLEFEQIYQRIGRSDEEVTAGKNGASGVPAQAMVNQIRAQLQALDEALKAKTTANQAVDAQLNGLNQSGVAVDGLKTKFGELGNAANNFGVQAAGGINQAKSSVDSLISEVNKAIDALNSLNKASSSTKAPSAPSSSPSSSSSSNYQAPSLEDYGSYDQSVGYERLGGLVQYAREGFMSSFARGSFSRGSDDLPIMANRKEVLINENSARKFYPQLMAINRGIDPGRMQSAQGGTNNFHIGGIHVNGGDTSKQTVSNIVSGLNRAARRGNIKSGR